MNIFIDTSALLAVLDADDARHQRAKAFWENAINAGDRFVSHNYVLVETSALVGRRLGIEAFRIFERDVVSFLDIIWVTREIHSAAASALLIAARRSLSLVDCVSFEIMGRTGIQTAFAFDRHFLDYGYEAVP